jgi:hypothetical protein
VTFIATSGDWLLVTRKKKIPNSPTPLTTKTVKPKATNRFTALNNLTSNDKADPPNQVTHSRPNPTDQSCAPQFPKETKRRRHDDDIMSEPILQYSMGHTPSPSIPTQKKPPKTAYVAKSIPKTPNNKETIHDQQKHGPP